VGSRFEDSYFSRERRFSLGVDVTEGGHYASFPVTSGIVDYEEYYRLTPKQYEAFMANPDAALAFVESCRRHERDELLIQKPGWNRGTPM
jgi:hypothetical protein